MPIELRTRDFSLLAANPNPKRVSGVSLSLILSEMPGERQNRTTHAQSTAEATSAGPGEMLARQFDALPRYGLERLLALDDSAAPLLVDRGDGIRTWFERDGWRVFSSQTIHDGSTHEAVARFRLENGSEAALVRDGGSGRIYAPFDLAEAYEAYVSEIAAAATGQRKLSAGQLDTFYRVKRFIPRSLQLTIRRLFVRWQGLPKFPAWPLDRSVARLLRLYAFCVLSAQERSEAQFRWFWPAGHSSALSLTHDVEGDEGLRLAVQLADLEEGLGFRSSFNLGGWYKVDPGLLRELTGRGFEIGVHGLRHDRSLFATRSSFEAQQQPLRELLAAFGAVGFRSPATHRVFDWIGELPIEYDCSVPHSDPFEPQPGGCCSVWPFFIGPVVELPYTLPQDHTLFTLLRHRTPNLWVEQATEIDKEHGLIECLTHPDPGYLGNSRNRAMYGEFLSAMAERPGIWKALPREIAAWWRARDAGEGESERGRVRIGDEPEDVVFEPPAAVTVSEN